MAHHRNGDNCARQETLECREDNEMNELQQFIALHQACDNGLCGRCEICQCNDGYFMSSQDKYKPNIYSRNNKAND